MLLGSRQAAARLLVCRRVPSSARCDRQLHESYAVASLFLLREQVDGKRLDGLTETEIRAKILGPHGSSVLPVRAKC